MALKVPSLDLQLQKITQLADGTAPTDAVTKAQLDAMFRGLKWKNSVKVATVGPVTLSAPQTIDSVAVVAGDRVLVKDQASALTNGIYVVASGAWTHATDFDDSVEVTTGAAIPIEQGSANGDSVQILTTDATITVGTTALVFTRLGGAGVSYTAGANGGLTLSGSAFSVLLDTNSGLVLGAGGLKIDPSQFANLGIARKYAADLASGSTTVTITHNLGTVDVHVQIVEKAAGTVVLHEESSRTTNTAVLVFAVAPTTGQYRAIVIG